MLRPPDSSSLQRGRPELLKPLFGLSADIGATADDVQFILQEKAASVAIAPVDHRAETTAAGFLGLADGVAQVHAHVGSFNVHVTHTNAAAVEVAVFEEVHDGLGENEGDVEAVRFRNGRNRGRLNGIQRSTRRGRGCW